LDLDVERLRYRAGEFLLWHLAERRRVDAVQEDAHDGAWRHGLPDRAARLEELRRTEPERSHLRRLERALVGIRVVPNRPRLGVEHDEPLRPGPARPVTEPERVGGARVPRPLRRL